MNEDSTLVEETENQTIDAPSESTGQPVEELSQHTGSATLVVKRNGAETEESFVVTSPCVIGRFDPSVGPIDIDLAGLPEGVYVSRKHAKLVQDESGWKVVDMGSSNGTFVLVDDFEKVDEHAIVDGTEIALGNARFVFHLN